MATFVTSAKTDYVSASLSDEDEELTLMQVAAGRSLDFIAVFNPSRRADSSGEAFGASSILEVLRCLIDDEPEAMVLLIANMFEEYIKS